MFKIKPSLQLSYLSFCLLLNNLILGFSLSQMMNYMYSLNFFSCLLIRSESFLTVFCQFSFPDVKVSCLITKGAVWSSLLILLSKFLISGLWFPDFGDISWFWWYFFCAIDQICFSLPVRICIVVYLVFSWITLPLRHLSNSFHHAYSRVHYEVSKFQASFFSLPSYMNIQLVVCLGV